ncbi:XdhC/CoxI family protein [Methylovirgula ligni]|uniref:Xanthine dehydrogenase accessory factor n=1 Tax=Methylovirgula ligni TaxID=569860 RepID=A0A3D9Z1V9_9HYPH|nr:XdhC family protein [Methylovirgula ligni]QAY95510.1 XdhC/CoxI family protein [Methylovirgula ligni]REF89153.1 xanthine dehydrogenase accessory factor [Methylovirgula ligni]
MLVSDAEILQTALDWHTRGSKVAIATVIETWGSAPRPVGSQLVIDADGRFVGSVSGGCVEADVIADALDVLADGRPCMREFGVSDETAWRAGLSCGGRIKIFVERVDLMQARALSELSALERARHASVLVIDIATGALRIVSDGELEQDPLGIQLRAHLGLGKSGLIEATGRSLFLRVNVPRLRMIVLGAVHIAQALAPIAKLAGYDVTVIDPRSAFATQERFAGVNVIAEWPERVFIDQGLDHYTAMVVLSHVPAIDDPGITAALAADCFYIGALGSRKTNAARLDRLRGQNIPEAALARIHAPIGLDIGAASAGEIAIAIIAEVIASKRQKPLRFEEAA